MPPARRIVALLSLALLLPALPVARPAPACLEVAGGCPIPALVDEVQVGDPSLFNPEWPMYGHDLWGTHANAAEAAINRLTVDRLALQWTFPIPGGIAGASVMSGGIVYAAAWNGHVYAIDALLGKPVWVADLGQTMTATPAVNGGIVYVTTLYPGNLVALDALHGTQLWKVPLDDVAEGWGSPVVVGDIVLVGQSGGDTGLSPPHRGSVQAFEGLTGKLLWRTYTTPPGPPGAPVWTTPAVLGNTLFVGTGNDFTWGAGQHSTAIEALNVTTGGTLWFHHFDDFGDEDFGASPQLFLSGGAIVLGEAQKLHYHALDPLTGDVYWSKVTGGDWTIGTPAVADGNVYGIFGAGGGWWSGPDFATSLSTRDGSVQWRGAPMGALAASAVAGQVAFFADQDGTLRGYDALTGDLLWTGRVPAGTFSGPVIAAGHLYEGSLAGVSMFALA